MKNIAETIAATEGQRIVVLIPACQEEASIGGTVKSILSQTVPPTAVIVAVNNCTDNTAGVAEESGALVFNANPNNHKKAGALNMALEYLDQFLSDSDFVIVADADTEFSPEFIETALANYSAEEKVGGVGAMFIGRPSKSVIGTLQQMEYSRYSLSVRRYGHRAFVLAGTGTLFPVSSLRAVRGARKIGTLPDGASFYDIRSLTEDNEISIALLSLGYRCVAPASDKMQTTTDLMETPKALWKQRQRWYLGAIWNIHDYGTKMPWYVRWVYWKQQVGLLMAMLVACLNTALVVACVAYSMIGLSPLSLVFIAVSATNLVLQTRAVWHLGIKARILSVLQFDQFYSFFLMAVYASAVVKYVRGHRGGWTLT